MSTRNVPPVLFTVFNRPDLTEQVMGQIRKAEPPQLFVAADGPRTGMPEDPERCDQAREVATRVDWDCEVHTLFRDENLGCKEAVSSAITWFFEHVEAGIILEDDCVPHPTFFGYCSELLERYRDDKRVMVVSGNNFQPEHRTYPGSYYFSVYHHSWGWATWGEAWDAYDGDISDWPSLRDTSWLKGWLGSKSEAQYWARIFDKVHRGEIDAAWDYPWIFSCWREHGLTALPAANLVSNIGFGDRATHTKNADSDAAHLPVESIPLPLTHPSTLTRHYEADRFTSKRHFGIQEKNVSVREEIRRFIPERLKAPLRPIARHLRP